MAGRDTLVLTTSTTIATATTHLPPLPPLATSVVGAINHPTHEEERKYSHKKACLVRWCRWLKQVSEVSCAVSFVVPKISLESLRLYLHYIIGTRTRLKPDVWPGKKKTRTGIFWITEQSKFSSSPFLPVVMTRDLSPQMAPLAQLVTLSK